MERKRGTKLNGPEDDHRNQDLQQHQAEQHPLPHASSRCRLVEELIRLSKGKMINNGCPSGRKATYGESTPLELVKFSSDLVVFLFDKVTLPLQAFTFDSRLASLDSEL